MKLYYVELIRMKLGAFEVEPEIRRAGYFLLWERQKNGL